MHASIRRRPCLGLILLACLASVALLPTLAGAQPAEEPAEQAQAEPALRAVPAEMATSMPVEDIRIGMKGYGLTVFHGTEIEPFPVEVISIVNNTRPNQSVVWIRCDDPRLAKSGPVQGMSGSPIYLWEQGEAGEPGEGGRLIGAFAYGFSLSKECIAGVQPIEYMRQVGQRAVQQQGPPPAQKVNADGAGQPPHRVTHLTSARRTLARLAQMVAQRGPEAENVAPRLDAWQALLDPTRINNDRANNAQPLPREPSRPTPPTSPRDAQPSEALTAPGRVVPLLLPMSVGSPEIATLVDPLLKPLGISAVGTSQGFVSGPPPQSINADTVALEPGSVLAVPLAFGDLDLAAGGTVTEVLPDGTVLGFGHAMYGQGDTSLPMATGFVHFVVPRVDQSFKLAGSLNIRGSLLRDEVAAVAGRGSREFATAPVSVSVQMPGRPAEQYEYEVVDHRDLTPTLATIVTLRSISALHDPPQDTTLRLRGEMQFSGGHTLEVDTMMPSSEMMGVMMEMTPPIMLAMQNPHEQLKLESVDVRTEITPGQQTASIINARLDQATVAPGETVGVTVWIQPYGEQPQRLRTTIEIPPTLADGDYPLVISDAQVYLAQLMDSRPHLFTTHDVDDLMHMMQRILSVKRNAIHLTLRLSEEGIAVGRRELPQLPSSRRAMIFTPTSTVARPFMDTVNQAIETNLAITGQRMFTVHVRSDPTATQPPPGRRNQ